MDLHIDTFYISMLIFFLLALKFLVKETEDRNRLNFMQSYI